MMIIIVNTLVTEHALLYASGAFAFLDEASK